MKNLTIDDAGTLKPGDKIILNVAAGAEARLYYVDPKIVIERLKHHGLEDGKTYTFEARRGIFKPGEGSFVGWYIDVAEQIGDPRLGCEYYVITPDLEARLAERRQNSR